jgi:NAD(P)-dependent dehydrogenase (short-subunit alcohol dehydrogenase family)
MRLRTVTLRLRSSHLCNSPQNAEGVIEGRSWRVYWRASASSSRAVRAESAGFARLMIPRKARTFGGIDAIHNNGGISNPTKPLHETTEEERDLLYQVNLKSVYWTTRFGLSRSSKAMVHASGCLLLAISPATASIIVSI